jgi:hypothetical protein
MKWNAFSLISPSIERTKKRLFPFQFWEWFRLMIIVALARSKGAGNFNYNSSGRGDSSSIKSFSEASSKLREAVKKYWVVGAGIFVIGFILMTIFSYIQSVFSFIFIDALVDKKAKFTFRKNNSKGVSLFLFKFFISILTIITIAGLAFPYIFNFIKGNPIIAYVGWGYITLSITAAIIYFLLLWILFLFVYDFAVPYMYVKNTSAWFSLKKVWDDIGKNKLETLVYWIARLVIGIVVGIIGILIAVLLFIAFFLAGLLIFLIGFGLYKLIGAPLIFIILGIIIGIILFIVFLFTVGMVLLPINVFFRYFQLIAFENIMKIKILKKRDERR